MKQRSNESEDYDRVEARPRAATGRIDTEEGYWRKFHE